MTPIPKIAGEVHRLASDLPDELILDLANSLTEYSGTDPRDLKTKILSGVTPPAVRQRVDKFFKYWQANVPEISAESMALALLTAAQVEEHYRNYQQLELVWTGPDSEFIPLRRTDQALLQLIDEANKTLHIVSFAVYKVSRISKALVQAASRGVRTRIYLETPDSSESKIAYDTVKALGKEVADHAEIYIWPLEKRIKNADGKHGSLHAKIAIADGRVMLISSANLTEYAMKLNMEMGLLVRGGPLPGQVKAHLGRLVEQKVFFLVG